MPRAELLRTLDFWLECMASFPEGMADYPDLVARFNQELKEL